MSCSVTGDQYRVYFIDGSDGIIDARWLAARSDGEALSEARALGTNLTREVWQDQRPVGRLAPVIDSTASPLASIRPAAIGAARRVGAP